MMTLRFSFVPILVPLLAACTTTSVGHVPERDLGLLWVKHAAEFEATSRQVYQAAGRALEDFVADQSWSALPWQEDAEGLRPAIIFDVDETVVSNVDFQLGFERPFENRKLDEWSRSGPSTPIPGFAEFAHAARQAGVELFFVTNRPCEFIAGDPDPCPQQRTTIDDIAEAGIETDADHVLLAYEQEGWGKEKLVRRQLIAASHRVIMLIGDDLGDFIPCVREKPAGPCTEAATAESRRRAVERHADRWGHGWYVLPNPMHGSWTSQL
jgi:acid phosphatase